MNINPTVSTKPMLLVICSWLIIIGGVSLILLFLLLGFLGGFYINYIGINVFLQTVATYLLPGLLLLGIGIDLKKLHGRILYVLPIVSLVSGYFYFRTMNPIFLIITFITILPAGYGLTHRNLFS